MSTIKIGLTFFFPQEKDIYKENLIETVDGFPFL